MIVFLLTSKHDNHQADLLHRLKGLLTTEFKDVSIPAAFTDALRLFTRDEIIDSPFPGQEALEQHSSVHKFSAVNPEIASYFIQQLHVRIIEHNLRVVAKYYRRVSLQRLSELVRLDGDTLEAHLSNMSFQGDLHLKIDRPAGIVTFRQHRGADEVLSDWSGDISNLLGLMESTCHLVNREIMVHKL